MSTKFIYFGQYTNEEITQMGLDTDDLFVHNGNHYEFQMEVMPDDGTIRINDSCGRHMPFDVTHYRELYNAVVLVNDIQHIVDARNSFQEELDRITRIGLKYDSDQNEVFAQ